MKLSYFDLSKPTSLTGHISHPDDFAGNVGTKLVPTGYELVRISEEEARCLPVMEHEIREDIQFYRLDSARMRLAGIQPYVKINVDRGLIYYLTTESSQGIIDRAVFEARGVQITYLNLDVSRKPEHK